MRVSTVDQHPETQLYDLRQMAVQRGYEVVAEYADKISGTRAKRPGLDRMMADARRGRFDVVLVWASDRIARSVKHFLDVLDELNRLQIESVSTARASARSPKATAFPRPPSAGSSTSKCRPKPPSKKGSEKPPLNPTESMAGSTRSGRSIR